MIYKIKVPNREKYEIFITKLRELFIVDGVRVCGDFETKQGYVNSTPFGYVLSDDFTVTIEKKEYEVLPIYCTFLEVYFECKKKLEL